MGTKGHALKVCWDFPIWFCLASSIKDSCPWFNMFQWQSLALSVYFILYFRSSLSYNCCELIFFSSKWKIQVLDQGQMFHIGNLVLKKYQCWNNSMTSIILIFQSNILVVLGLAFKYGRVMNRVVKLSAVFDYKICHGKFITVPWVIRNIEKSRWTGLLSNPCRQLNNNGDTSFGTLIWWIW